MDADQVNILVVDDLADKRLAFRAVLEELGQNIVMASSGAQALGALLEREFAVILLDVNMPDIDGIETAELIRSHKKTAHIPIIFVTAYADEMQTARGYQLGAVDYILSPIVPEILRSKVRVFADLYRAQQRARTLARSEVEREAAEEARRRSQFLAHASGQLGASLDLREGAERLLGMLVPRFAPSALLRLHLGTERLALACSGDSARIVELSAEALPITLVAPMESAAQEGVGGELWIQGSSGLPPRIRYAEVLPLRGAGQTVAVLVLGHQDAPRNRLAADQATLDELISRAAMAFENGRLYWNLQREMARSKDAEEELQQMNRRKDEFLAMLSHELRNPLAPIRNAAEVMRRIPGVDPTVAWGCQVVERQVTHLSQLVDDLLDVSRITQGKISLKKEAIELGKVIHQAVETARSLIDAKKHTLVTQLPETPIWLHGDFARLAQVIGNLLSNSAKYTPEAGRITLSAAAASGEVLITVGDNGIGIEPDLLPHIFDPFIQGQRSLDRSQGGLGIGLTVVQRLVALHQGRIEVETEGAGKGAVFRVALPCVSEVPRPGEKAVVASHAERGSGCRILVVDDNMDAAHSMAVLLRMEGHEVKAVRDGREALALAEAFAPQVAVVDIGLPGMDGYEVAARLRESRATAQLLLIAVTGYGQEEDRGRSEAAGFNHHFVKPADPQLIHAAIRAWAAEKRQSLLSDTFGAA